MNPLLRPLLILHACLAGLILTGCQSPVVNPNSPSAGTSTSHPVIVAVPNAPAQHETAPSTETVEAPEPKINPPTRPHSKPPKPVTARDILAQQRAQSTTPITPKPRQSRDGSKIPAFNKLMKIGVRQLRANKLRQAQQTFTKAQRLGPQSPAVYMYLSEIAIKNKQGSQAESLARRGLLVSRSTRYDRALWKLVLISAQMRNRDATIKEAQLALAKL